MRILYCKSTIFICATVLILLVTTNSLEAQIRLERELIGAVVATSTSGSNSTSSQLEVDASVGETLIGYAEGDIILTVGFQQGDVIIQPLPFDDSEDQTVTQPAEIVKVTAYPNPTVNRLTIDLGIHTEKFSKLRLINSVGNVMMAIQVSLDQQVIVFDQLSSFPNGNYFLQGIGVDGRNHYLSTVMIVNQSE